MDWSQHKAAMLLDSIVTTATRSLWMPIWHLTASNHPLKLTITQKMMLEESLQELVNETLKLKELVRTAEEE